MKKNKNIIVEGISFDKQIFKACGDYGVVRRAYFNADENEVVATDRGIMLVEKVENPTKQESGYFDILAPTNTMQDRNGYLNGNDTKYSWIIENDWLSFPEYKRIFDYIGEEFDSDVILHEHFKWVYTDDITVLSEDDWKLSSKNVKTYVYLPYIETVFDEKYFKIVSKWFDDFKNAKFYFDNPTGPLFIKQGNKTAVIMPMRVKLPTKYVRIEKRKAYIIK